jgi:hypothetical protein
MKNEIIIKFPNKEIKNKFLGQMSDGVGENFSDFSLFHEENGKYLKKYDSEGRLICIVNEIFDEYN